jgi:integrase
MASSGNPVTDPSAELQGKEKPEPYIQADGTRVPSLYRYANGVWRISYTGETFAADANEATMVALAQSRRWRRRLASLRKHGPPKRPGPKSQYKTKDGRIIMGLAHHADGRWYIGEQKGLGGAKHFRADDEAEAIARFEREMSRRAQVRIRPVAPSGSIHPSGNSKDAAATETAACPIGPVAPAHAPPAASSQCQSPLVIAPAAPMSATDILAMMAQEWLFEPFRVRIREQASRPLSLHLEEFKIHLTAKGDAERWVGQSIKRVRMIVRLCRATYWNQLSMSAVQGALGKLAAPRPNKPTRKSRGLKTVNHYLTSFRTFANWMINDGRAERSPARSIKPYAASMDVRRRRRVLSQDELLRLVQAANAGKTIAGIPGTERAMCYVVAATTGLRSGEIQNLRRENFRVDPVRDAQFFHIVVDAAYSRKHRRTKKQPVRQDVAKLLWQYLQQTPRDEGLLRRPKNANHSLRVDMLAAGVPYKREGEYADFHSLRHAFATFLFETGASPKEAQTLLRHQTPSMTLGHYAHVSEAQTQAAIERLPAPPSVTFMTNKEG